MNVPFDDVKENDLEAFREAHILRARCRRNRRTFDQKKWFHGDIPSLLVANGCVPDSITSKHAETMEAYLATTYLTHYRHIYPLSVETIRVHDRHLRRCHLADLSCVAPVVDSLFVLERTPR